MIKHISSFVAKEGQGGKETARLEFLVVSDRKATHIGLNMQQEFIVSSK